MIVYPAIDLLDGRCVRLLQGRYDEVTVYGHDPTAVAKQFEADGASWIHVIDLDAAREGVLHHRRDIAAIKRETGLKVQTGGGIRSLETIDHLLVEDGLDRVIVGTAAVQNQALLRQALKRYPDQIAIGVDARDSMVCTDGWTAQSRWSDVSFIRLMAQLGARTIIYTDIRTDGTLQGPPLDQIRKLVAMDLVDVIASGGIGSEEDIEAVRQTGAAGVIVGKALYEGKVRLNHVL